MAQVKVLTKKIPVRRSSIGSDATFEDMSATKNGILKYEVVMGSSDVKNFRDGDNFFPFDGEIDGFQNETFPEKDEFSYSIGSAINSFFSPEETKARREARRAKKSAKTEEIKSRADLNKGLGTEKQSDIELAKALQDGDKKPGLSTGAIVGIAVGGLALIGIVIFALKSKKK